MPRNWNYLNNLAQNLYFAVWMIISLLTEAMRGAQVVISLIHGTSDVIGQREEFVLKAAIRAQTVKRFVPSEFGCNTLAMKTGMGKLFDEKKRFQQRLKEENMDYTLIFSGLIFDYSLPNLREFKEITTFGDLELEYPVTSCEDIGIVTVKAALDPRCVNKGVQIKANWIRQADFIPKLKQFWPNYEFPMKHVDKETVLHLAEHGDPLLPHEQPELERFQINRACYVLPCVTGAYRHENRNMPDTLDAQTLFPDIKFKCPDDVLADPLFVFGKEIQ
jgi:hypothetical protein